MEKKEVEEEEEEERRELERGVKIEDWVMSFEKIYEGYEGI